MNQELLPVCIAEAWEDHVAIWIELRDQVSERQWKLGAVAVSVASKWGETSLAAFARDVQERPRTVQQYAQVYRSLMRERSRFANLSWAHFLIALEAPPEERLRHLEEASDSGASVRELRRLIHRRTVEREIPETTKDPQFAAAALAWRALRPAVLRFAAQFPQYRLYTEDFIADVDEEINRPAESAREWVERLISAGVREPDTLERATGLQADTVQDLCDDLVEAGTHEWREQGGETDEARGARRHLICPK